MQRLLVNEMGKNENIRTSKEGKHILNPPAISNINCAQNFW